ncbi:MAG: hypothetical protein K9J27_03055 [Bacteroidales bacterium]|nr:hypothetical protein [Bacteroidales bacterium]MCF8333929.1 hypothetical protein [Bacteroidales bacterium]
MSKTTLVNNHRELVAIKSKLREQLTEEEKNFVKDYESLSRFIDLSGIYKNKKHRQAKKDIHALVVKVISDILGEAKFLGTKKGKLNNLLLPSLTLGLSLFVVNLIQRRSAGKEEQN